MTSQVGSTERRNAQILTNLPETFDVAVPKETWQDREIRLHKEMKISNKIPYINSVPYEYIGHDIRHLYPSYVPDSERINYPDWHKLTPAYKLSFAGMTPTQHIKSFFSFGNTNSGLNRVKRWASEDKVITYSDTLDKLSTLAGILMLVMVFMITIIQLRSKSIIAYHAVDTTNADDANDVKLLTKLSNNKYWNITKLFLSGVPMIIAGYNVFKRTSVPIKTVRIIDFENGIVEKGALATDRNLRRRNKISESEDSMGPMPSLIDPMPSYQSKATVDDQRKAERTTSIRSMLPARMGVRDEVTDKNRPLTSVEAFKYNSSDDLIETDIEDQ